MYSTFLPTDPVDAALASFNPEIEDECGLARSLASRVDDSRLFATTEPLYYREMVLRSTTLGESAWMLTGTFPLQSIAHF